MTAMPPLTAHVPMPVPPSPVPVPPAPPLPADPLPPIQEPPPGEQAPPIGDPPARPPAVGAGRAPLPGSDAAQSVAGEEDPGSALDTGLAPASAGAAAAAGAAIAGIDGGGRPAPASITGVPA